MQRQIRLIAALLPADQAVQRLAESTALASDPQSLRDSLLLHLTETYRLHRRMLRTRRVWLAESDRFFRRRMHVACEYELDEVPPLKLWQILDEWRTTVAGRLAGDAVGTSRAAEAYLQLAEAISAELWELPTRVQAAIASLQGPSDEQALLARLRKDSDAAVSRQARMELVVAIVQKRLVRLKKGVIYVPSAIVADLGAMLVRRLGQDAVLTADLSRSAAAAATAQTFATGRHRVLVTDAVLEEGFNLQGADFILFYHLPWSPWRIEQRIGRLDRIDRIGPIDCTVLVSGEDETLCVDEAWRQLLAEGLGVFKQSISDLQHLVDAQMEHWRERMFTVGPAGIADLITEIQALVGEERQSIDEQDAIDGMGRVAISTTLVQNLRQADRVAPELQRALAIYLKESVGLRQSWREEDNTIVFSLPRDESPRIPSERLSGLQQMLNRPVTTLRQVAVESFATEFLRPGHPAITGCEELLSWDDRGRAYAVWRPCAQFEVPRVVFRCFVRVSPDLQSVRSLLEAQQWDAIERGGLLRMLAGWMGEFWEELVLDVEGVPVDEAIAVHCRLPYQKPRDQSLGKERAVRVRTEFGAETWGTWCRTVAEVAVERVKRLPQTTERCQQGVEAATRHFALVRARLGARQVGQWENADAIASELARQQQVEELALIALGHPAFSLDTIGGYVLSARPLSGSSSP